MSKLWRLFDTCSKVANQEKNKPPLRNNDLFKDCNFVSILQVICCAMLTQIYYDEVHQVLCKAVEEICTEKQFQEKCLFTLVHAMKSYKEYTLEGKHVSDSEKSTSF